MEKDKKDNSPRGRISDKETDNTEEKFQKLIEARRGHDRNVCRRGRD